MESKGRDVVMRRAGDVTWQDFRSALVSEFNARFRTEVPDFFAWQALCAIVSII
jgi:hypothetical protein